MHITKLLPRVIVFNLMICYIIDIQSYGDNAMKYKVAIFDLDGTVLATLKDLANAVNHALKANGYETHGIEQVRCMVGNGVANLIWRALPKDISEAIHAKVLADFKAYYRDHVNVCTKPYDGVCEMLKSLRDAGIYVGINSNKYDAALQSLCKIHFDGLYDYAAGECETTPKKPDPTAAERIIAAAGAEKSGAIYIGDSDVDIRTAENAGIDSAWVSWGFRRRNELEGAVPMHEFHDTKALTAFLLGE